MWAVTVCVGAGAGLEYGIAAGAAADAARTLAAAARPQLHATLFKVMGRRGNLPWTGDRGGGGGVVPATAPECEVAVWILAAAARLAI